MWPVPLTELSKLKSPVLYPGASTSHSEAPPEKEGADTEGAV